MDLSFKSIKENIEELYQYLGKVEENELKIFNPDFFIQEVGIFFAMDHDNNIHVLMQVNDNRKIVEDKKSKGIKILSHKLQSETETYHFIDVVCFLTRLKKLFIYFIEDLLSKINPKKEDINYTCLSVLDQWRAFFEQKHSGGLKENQIIGLLAELIFLRKLLEFNPKAAIYWVGPENDRYDFYNNNIALEIKATKNREGRYTEIHGFQQLETPVEGILYLGFIKFEKTTTQGLNLPEIIQDILKVTIEKQTFIDKICKVGYSFAFEEEYEKYKYIIPPGEDRLYLVDDEFPKIISNSFINEKIPNLVINVKYKIDLSGEPPTPLDSKKAAEIYRKLV